MCITHTFFLKPVRIGLESQLYITRFLPKPTKFINLQTGLLLVALTGKITDQKQLPPKNRLFFVVNRNPSINNYFSILGTPFPVKNNCYFLITLYIYQKPTTKLKMLVFLKIDSNCINTLKNQSKISFQEPPFRKKIFIDWKQKPAFRQLLSVKKVNKSPEIYVCSNPQKISSIIYSQKNQSLLHFTIVINQMVLLCLKTLQIVSDTKYKILHSLYFRIKYHSIDHFSNMILWLYWQKQQNLQYHRT
eukprot:TRINITY_DN12837_c0_g3_i1.p1 TRINITY_DN12837_c0_g3~~TRINITY_DN12837_c0_g3_i1.p1  ORF type:complete len:247 (-),score=-31.67 TRINITY_DN12837_c0_g3_i1:596-1336(-)